MKKVTFLINDCFKHGEKNVFKNIKIDCENKNKML